MNDNERQELEKTIELLVNIGLGEKHYSHMAYECAANLRKFLVTTAPSNNKGRPRGI